MSHEHRCGGDILPCEYMCTLNLLCLVLSQEHAIYIRVFIYQGTTCSGSAGYLINVGACADNVYCQVKLMFALDKTG